VVDQLLEQWRSIEQEFASKFPAFDDALPEDYHKHLVEDEGWMLPAADVTASVRSFLGPEIQGTFRKVRNLVQRYRHTGMSLDEIGRDLDKKVPELQHYARLLSDDAKLGDMWESLKWLVQHRPGSLALLCAYEKEPPGTPGLRAIAAAEKAADEVEEGDEYVSTIRDHRGFSADPSMPAPQIMAELLGIIPEEQPAGVQPDWADDSESYQLSQQEDPWPEDSSDQSLSGLQARSAAIAGYEKLFPGRPAEMYATAYDAFGNTHGLCFLFALHCSDLYDPRAAEVVDGCIKARLCPDGLIRQCRAQIHEYWRHSGQRWPTTLSPEEKKVIRRMMTQLELLRTFPTVPNAMAALVNLGPYAEASEAVKIKQTTAGESDWLAANNVLSTGTMEGKYVGTKPLPPPVWRDPSTDEVVRKELGNVIITNVYAEGMPNVVALIEGAFGTQRIMSKFRQPMKPFYVSGDPVKYVCVHQSGGALADALHKYREVQIVVHTPSNAMLEKLVNALWGEGGTWTIVCNNAHKLNIDRLERTAIARKEAEERRKKAAKLGLGGAGRPNPFGGGNPFAGRGGAGPSAPMMSLALSYAKDVLPGWQEARRSPFWSCDVMRY